ncbi:hypothetical protein OV079_52500 [Nannocystis pusilla]|uniref:Uncharacterized protein n=1 Tax=Nannocystis pusilla TaxID=889268 RepID=A0A9X3J2N9_9BACT|nr:hypothetical protein [Nannocystis pusilla]MCY1014007.1 hypothetical protein [Nannocystis pusilla]
MLDAGNDRRFPAKTPIPLSYIDKVRPTLTGPPGAVQCQIDDGPVERDETFEALLHDSREKVGFHRLRCWPEERPDEAATTSVQIVSAGVVFASSDAAFVQRIEAGEQDSGANSQSPADRLRIDINNTK